MAIISFADKATQTLWYEGKAGKNVAWSSWSRVALRKLTMLNGAAQVTDLRAPPGNRLEALRGSLTGFFSIRVNDQWRIVFQWTENGPADVRITDYH